MKTSIVNLPKHGDKIYIPTLMSLSHGLDDVQGGLATIEKVETSSYLSEDHVNYIMIKVKEIPNKMYNYRSLMTQQNELRQRFGDQIAHPDPDDRSEFNDDQAGWIRY